MMMLPAVCSAEKLSTDGKRVFIGAYGFEERSLGWVKGQAGQLGILQGALAIRYVHPKGANRVREMKRALSQLGVACVKEVEYDVGDPHLFEEAIGTSLESLAVGVDEIVVDITAMTKLIILVSLCALRKFEGTVRVVYSEAVSYSPSQEEYEVAQTEMERMARYPSSGATRIIRTRCMGSVRMQGEPVVLVAFTSFNEQLVRHMLGTISPHRLLFISGRPPRDGTAWRERATQEIHGKLVDQYAADNPRGEDGLLERVASTLDYRETVARLEEVYSEFWTSERIMCAATGSKMQTVGLFFSKMAHPDIHIEYPTPDSYYVQGMSKEVRGVHEVVVPRFAEFVESLRDARGRLAGGRSLVGEEAIEE